MIRCPSCHRRAFTRRDIFYASLDGMAQCPVCGRIARLDVFSRWMLSCVLAVLLPSILLYGNVFYSGHFFTVSLLLTLGFWRLLSYLGLPFLSLEAPTSDIRIAPRQGLWIVATLVAAAMILDLIMASRFESETAGYTSPPVASVRH